MSNLLVMISEQTLRFKLANVLKDENFKFELEMCHFYWKMVKFELLNPKTYIIDWFVFLANSYHFYVAQI
jgi:hypothetical protein